MSSNSLRPIVVDDSDSQVRYTEGWFQDIGSQDGVGNFGPTYNHTLHGMNSNGSFSFTFHGTSIRIFGTTHILNTAGVINPHWECFVDEDSIGATEPFAFPENNWLLCERGGLNDGPHEITVNVTTDGQTFWFDYLQYTLSSGVSFDTAAVLVENSDPGLVFDSQWRPLGSVANLTHSTGSQASFNFTGTSLTWLGFIPTEFPHNASTAIFSIDDGPPQTFPLNGLPSGPATTIYNQVFFTTPKLPAGPHTLLVTYTGSSQQTPLTLDYIYITNTSTQANPIANVDPTPIPSQSSISTSQLPDKRGFPIGAIIGGVIGVLALIVLIPFLLWWYKYGEKKKRNSPMGATIRSLDATPFMPPYTQQSSMAAGHKASFVHQPWPSVTDSGYHASANISRSKYYAQPSASVNGQLSLATYKGGSQSSGSALMGHINGAFTQARTAGERDETAAEPVHRRMVHQDSGVRLHQGRRMIVEDVPPDYTPD